MERTPVSETEYRILRLLAEKHAGRGPIEEIAERIGVDASTLHSVARLLADKGLVSLEVEEQDRLELTERGRQALEEGLPEEKLLSLLKERGGRIPVGEANRILGREAGVAIGLLKRAGALDIRDGELILLDEAKAVEQASMIRRVLEEVARGRLVGEPGDALKRGLVRLVKVRRYILDAASAREALDRVEVEVARLDSEMLRSGMWRSVKLRSYDVTAEPPRVLPARIHFLTDFIEMLRDIMKELGFREEKGPIVELELFNFDLLFQAQDHPAREIHDTLWIKDPSQGSLDEYSSLVERAARVHERGWGYKWSPEIAARLVLRSQTTSVSARVIARRPRAPVRVFTIGRVFRSDVVDATHLPEFHQLDGIDGDNGYTFRDLLGLLEEVAERLGLRLKFKPAYFPFTEPSVEGYVKLPNGKWLELFGAGMFRPEVLEMAGVDYPVGAWGFGIERLAAAYYGIPDIRLLYSRDIDYIRGFRVRV